MPGWRGTARHVAHGTRGRGKWYKLRRGRREGTRTGTCLKPRKQRSTDRYLASTARRSVEWMTQARGHKKNRPRAASIDEPPLTDGGPAATASKSCEGYLSRLAKAEAVSSMPRCSPPRHTAHHLATQSRHSQADARTHQTITTPTPRWLVDAERHLRTSPAGKERPLGCGDGAQPPPAGAMILDGHDGHNAHGEPCWLAEAWSEVGISGREEAEEQEQLTLTQTLTLTPPQP